MGKSRAKSSLKSSLQSQQSRLKDKQKRAQATHAAEQSGRKHSHKAKANRVPLLQKVTVPFRPTDQILLIGEGNFSFARALICNPPSELEFLPTKNVTATAYDTEVECYTKYPDARAIVSYLKEKGVEVLFGVDGTKLEKVSALRGRRWNRIVWNFPHAGKGITDQDRNIRANQLVIMGFLRSAAGFLALGSMPSVFSPKKRKQNSDDGDEGPDNDDDDDAGQEKDEETSNTKGTVLITLRNVPPYTLWDVPRLAKNPPAATPAAPKTNPPYVLLRSFKFHRGSWDGYEHRMTKGERVHGEGRTGEGGEDRTWEFCLRE